MSSRAPRGETKGSLPIRGDYGEGTYRRRIHLSADRHRVRGELEDDFHHFAATLSHDDRRVTSIEGEAIRVPWTTCPGSLNLLQELAGMRLIPSLCSVAKHTNPRLQCTHLFDVASLAVCHAARFVTGGARTRSYDVTLPDRSEGLTRPTLCRDGELQLRWTVRGMDIVESEPALFAGRTLSGAGFNLLARRQLSVDEAEAALVLRRGVLIGMGRQYDFDRIAKARTFAPIVGNACHTFSPPVVDGARRIIGSVRTFSGQPGELFRPEDGDDAA